MVNRLLRSCTMLLALVLSSLAIGQSANTLAATHDDGHKIGHSFGTHGMVIFGKSQVYLSHLGLYHAPHDRQIVLRAAFASNDAALHYQDLKATHQGLITAKPLPFALEKLAPNSSDFIETITVDIYTGHFEREGKLAIAGAVLTLEEPFIYAPLSVDMPSPKHAKFWLFGTGSEQYMTYKISSAPDQDYIFSVSSNIECAKKCLIEHSSQAKGPNLRFRVGDTKQFLLLNEPMRVTIEDEIYFETADFAR